MTINSAHSVPTIANSTDDEALGPDSGQERRGGTHRGTASSGERASSTHNESPDRRLANEHAVLLRSVTARVDKVIEAVAANRWPELELAALIDYLRSELISQTLIEERLLFVAADAESSAEAFSRLSRDHVRLRFALEALTDVAHENGRRDPQTLVAMLRDLLTQLTEHLIREQGTLSKYSSWLDWHQAVVAMERHPHAWYSLTHERVINLSDFPMGQAFAVLRPRIQQMQPGEQIELVSCEDPKVVCIRLLRDLDIVVRYLSEGPRTWRVTVTRRSGE